MSRFYGKRKYIKARYLEPGLSADQLLEWIESIPDTEDARNRTYWKAYDAAQDLIAYGTSATLPILARLSQKPNSRMRWIGFWVLKDVRDPQGKDTLWRLYQTHDDLEIKMSALEVLGILKDERIYETAVSLLSSENLSLRRTAMLALGNLGDVSAVELLIPLLDFPNDDIKLSAIWALGSLKDQRATAPLVRWIDKFPGSLVQAFAQIGGAESIQALETILNSPTPSNEDEGQYAHLRCDAVDALTQLGDPAALIVLEAATRHFSPSVRKRARKALQKLSPPT